LTSQSITRTHNRAITHEIDDTHQHLGLGGNFSSFRLRLAFQTQPAVFAEDYLAAERHRHRKNYFCGMLDLDEPSFRGSRNTSKKLADENAMTSRASWPVAVLTKTDFPGTLNQLLDFQILPGLPAFCTSSPDEIVHKSRLSSPKQPADLPDQRAVRLLRARVGMRPAGGCARKKCLEVHSPRPLPGGRDGKGRALTLARANQRACRACRTSPQSSGLIAYADPKKFDWRMTLRPWSCDTSLMFCAAELACGAATAGLQPDREPQTMG